VKFPAPIQAIIGLVAAILSAALVHELLQGLSLHAYAAENSALPIEWLALSIEVLTALGAFVVAAGATGVRWTTTLLLGAALWLDEHNSKPVTKSSKSRRRVSVR
jgi:hypothetical protein